MPKSPSSLSPSSPSQLRSDDPATRLPDVALRKKKNADAQAAFRARRANYIATLEETVTSLEAVVLQLQDSCREAKQEATELRQQNARLKHEARERDKYWRALMQARRASQAPEPRPDEMPPMSTYSYPPSTVVSTQVTPTHVTQYGDDNLRYPSNEEASATMPAGTYNAAAAAGQNYNGHSSTFAFSVDGDSQNIDAQRAAKYGNSQYQYGHQGAPRNSGPWPQSVSQTSSSAGDSAPQDSGSSSHSPGYVESPNLTSSTLAYVPQPRFNVVEEQKVQMTNLDSAPYMFPPSPEHSPTTSTPPSTSSAPITPYHFTFSDAPTVSHDRSEYDYRRQSAPGADITLHGGTADISMAGTAVAANGVRYRLGGRRATSGPDRPLPAPLPQLATTHHNHDSARRERGSSEGDVASSDAYAQMRSSSTAAARHRSGASSRINSRSPSPGSPPISGTLAVIKAQAFGALRRTKARTRKGSESAAKVAIEALSARGINLGVNIPTGSKRPRLHSDDEDT